jgi:hypothetical protein
MFVDAIGGVDWYFNGLLAYGAFINAPAHRSRFF